MSEFGDDTETQHMALVLGTVKDGKVLGMFSGSKQRALRGVTTGLQSNRSSLEQMVLASFLLSKAPMKGSWIVESSRLEIEMRKPPKTIPSLVILVSMDMRRE